jgi:hypothetical protein
VRSVTHDISGEHAAAANLVHTGRKPSGTILYPAIGSIVSHELGSKSEELPAYVVMGYPSIIRDPGFLGAKHGYVYLTQIETGAKRIGPSPGCGFESRGPARDAARRDARGLPEAHTADQTVQQQDAITKAAYKLAGPKFLNVFDLARENSTLRESYGGEFGQRCLLARRLVQSGVRFVEVSHNLNFLNGSGWDTHNEGQLKQHLLIPGDRHSLLDTDSRSRAEQDAGPDPRCCGDRVRPATRVRFRRRARSPVPRLQHGAGRAGD